MKPNIALGFVSQTSLRFLGNIRAEGEQSIQIFSTPAQAININFDNSWEKFGDVGIINPSQANLSTDGLFDNDADLNSLVK